MINCKLSAVLYSTTFEALLHECPHRKGDVTHSRQQHTMELKTEKTWGDNRKVPCIVQSLPSNSKVQSRCHLGTTRFPNSCVCVYVCVSNGVDNDTKYCTIPMKSIPICEYPPSMYAYNELSPWPSMCMFRHMRMLIYISNRRANR